MKESFFHFLKKHWLIVLILIAIPIAFILVFVLDKHIETTSADWIVLSGAVLTYVGTTLVSAVALYQSEKANELSEKVKDLYERPYFAAFAIEGVRQITTYDCSYFNDSEHSKITAERFMFCNVDITPEHCRGYQISIKNCGDYPITHLTVSTTYPIGRNRILERLERDIETLIPPRESREYILCNAPCFTADCGTVTFEFTCKNIFDYSAAIVLKIKNDSMQKESGVLSYSCKMLNISKPEK